MIRRATAADHDAGARELAAYLAFLGERLDGDGLDRDIARWQEIYDGTRGVMLLVVDPAGTVVGTAGVRLLAPGMGELKRMWIRPEHQGRGLGCRLLRLDSERRLEAAVHLYRAYGFTEIADYNGNPRAELWMEARL